MNIGYIGLGSMGSALARQLLRTHEVTVWDSSGAAMEALEKLGASVANSAAELARQCDTVLLCLPSISDVCELLFGSSGLEEALCAGKLIIDLTSGMPGEIRDIATQMAARGVAVIDAPVSGDVIDADAGSISILVSGSDTDCERALPILSAMSSKVFRCGGRVGDGQAMNLVNNLLSAGCRVATLEVVAMGRKMGLSLAALTDTINKGSGRNHTSKVTLQALADGNASPTHLAMALMLRDLNRIIQLGMEFNAPTPLANVVRGLLQIGVNMLGENAQGENVNDLIETMAASRIRESTSPEISQYPKASPSVGTKQLRVGYVGLGTMGGALARRLLLSRELRVFDARAETLSAFESEGVEIAADLPSLASECDVIFVCVPTSAIAREVILGIGGLVDGLSPGKVVVDQTTGDPTVTVKIASDLRKFGVDLIDAPVAGGARGAVAGTIAIMCGGSTDAFGKVRPILESISPNIVYCGKSGNGHIAKLINNSVSTCACLLTYEAAAIAVKYGLKLADVSAVINKSTGWSGASERILPTLSEAKATADFQLQLMVKDLRLAGMMAVAYGVPMLVARTVCSLYEMGAHELGNTANIDSMARLYETMADVNFTGA